MKKVFEDIQMGFISPTGEFIPCDLCGHEEKAYEFCQKMGVDPYDEPYTFADGASDVIVRLGWILIHGIGDITIEIPNKRPLTEPQKIALGDWAIKHKGYEKFFSRETLEILTRNIE